jgi:multicomponent Na+:H+ antiporter subunit B
MKFRNVIALIVIVLLGFILFQAFVITSDNGELCVSKFGQANLEDRTAQHYINKDVNNEQGEVIFNKTKNAESGSANIVTSVVVNYRAFDTLGEVTVLFLAATGLGAILYRKKEDKELMMKEDGSLILVTGVKILFPLLILLGTYIFIHGHLTPGGGFQGGSVVATAFLLMFLAKKDYRLNENKFKIVEGLAGVTFVGLGLYSLATEGSFLANFLNTGTIGQLFSGGIIPIIYIAIGFKVGAELAGIINDLVEA